MAIKIIATYTPMEDYDLGHFSIDLSRKTAVLIRQSMKKADKDHFESRLLQENLIPLAIRARGDIDDRNMLVFDEGAGVSGTKGYDERDKLSALYLAIANDIVGSLFLARPDRLFRDKHFTNVSMFTELAERKKLKLIIPGKRVYDFTKYPDLQAFQKDMQDAYGYLATHVKYMNDARDQKMQRGLYGGGNLPAPYVIDRAVWKDEQKPIIYNPWLEHALDLFKRFKAHDFSTSYICRYIESKPYLFPSPTFEDTQRYLFRTRMRLVAGGYTLSDVSTVRYYLSNLTLGGYMKVGEDEDGNELLLPNAFTSAIPIDMLDECYAAITGHYIDGSPFEGFRSTRRHMRSDPEGPLCLFSSNVLTSKQGHVTRDIRLNRGYYECCQGLQQEGYTLKLRSGLMTMKILWTLQSREIDRIIVERLIELAKHDTDMAERVRKSFENMKAGEVSETDLLRGQIVRTQQQVDRLDFLLTTPAIPLDVKTAQIYAQDLAELRPKLARLLKKQNTTSELDPGKTIANFYYILSHLPTEFHKQKIDVQQQMMSRLVKHIEINNISPHLFSLFIIWQDGIAKRPDVALLWRGDAVREVQGWSAQEDALLRSCWPLGNQLEVMRLFPQRTYTSLRQHANTLDVVRAKTLKAGRKKINMYEQTISFADLEAAKQYASEGGEEDITYICEIINELAAITPRGQLRTYWPLPVEIVGFSSFVSDSEGLCG
jgi:hypothetical protein